MTDRGNVLALIGGQWGSEGKGVIVTKIANRFGIHVRTGGTNAGHSFWHLDRKWVMQTVPCGWVNPAAQLVIAAGGLLELGILVDEIEQILTVDPTITSRLFIDSKCGVINLEHQVEEGGVAGEMHQRIGSTGKGVGAARRDRMMRDPSKFKSIRAWLDTGYDHKFSDGTKLSQLVEDNEARDMTNAVKKGISLLLEGTQGSGLDLIHADWPYVTSNGCGAAQLAADAGIPPQWITNVLMVCRTYPIRVAGNSGAMDREISWETLSQRIGKPVQEFTTVTKKVRRVSEWNEALVEEATVLNAPTSIALTFMDYLVPEDEGKTSYDSLSPASHGFVEYVEGHFGVSVPLIGTGGHGWQVVDRGLPL